MAHEETIAIETIATPINSLKALLVSSGTNNVLAKDITAGFLGGTGFIGSFSYSNYSDTVPATVLFYTGNYSGSVGAAYDLTLFSVSPIMSGSSEVLPTGSGGSGGTVIVTPLSGGSAVAGNGVGFGLDLAMYKGEQKQFQLTPLYASGDVIGNLVASDLLFVVHSKASTPVEQFRINSDSDTPPEVGGDTDETAVITVTSDISTLLEPGTYLWQLWQTSGVLLHGTLAILKTTK